MPAAAGEGGTEGGIDLVVGHVAVGGETAGDFTFEAGEIGVEHEVDHA